MGEIATVQYLKAQDIPAVVRVEKKLPSTGFIKKTIKFGSVITDMKAVADPASDVLKSLGTLKTDFGSLKEGDVSDIEKK